MRQLHKNTAVDSENVGHAPCTFIALLSTPCAPLFACFPTIDASRFLGVTKVKKWQKSHDLI